MSAIYATMIDSPVGPLRLEIDADGTLTGLYFDGSLDPDEASEPPTEAAVATAATATEQLADYFAGQRTEFDIPVKPAGGTEFQQAVWAQLQDIPYGHLRGYGDLAKRLDNPGAGRAVGLACGANPVSIVIPCHRVVGASGALTGFGGGLERKRFLLELERGQGELGL